MYERVVVVVVVVVIHVQAVRLYVLSKYSRLLDNFWRAINKLNCIGVLVLARDWQA